MRILAVLLPALSAVAVVGRSLEGIEGQNLAFGLVEEQTLPIGMEKSEGKKSVANRFLGESEEEQTLPIGRVEESEEQTLPIGLEESEEQTLPIGMEESEEQTVPIGMEESEEQPVTNRFGMKE